MTWLGHKLKKGNLKIKFLKDQMAIGHGKVFFFCFFGGAWYKDKNETKNNMIIPHRQPKI
jgi:hypothetical protein